MKIDIAKKNKAFTLIELMIIVLIIGLLLMIIASIGIISGKDKAAVNSYKTTMSSVQAGLELCGEDNLRFRDMSGIAPGNKMCNIGYDSTEFPKITKKCGDDDITFEVRPVGESWVVTTDQPCKNCKIICTPGECQPSSTNPDCY